MNRLYNWAMVCACLVFLGVVSTSFWFHFSDKPAPEEYVTYDGALRCPGCHGPLEELMPPRICPWPKWDFCGLCGHKLVVDPSWYKQVQQ